MIDIEKEQEASRLRGSLHEFTRYFFKYITGRTFILSNPVGRESHHISVCRDLTQIKRLEILRHIINIPPGSGKSTLISMFIAWCWTEYPDSNFIYTSYAHELATKHTSFIRSIVSSKMYKYLFDIELDPDSRAKDSFKTSKGGSIKAFGSSGAITGQDAGLPGLKRFSGCLIIDDAHKPDEAHSDTVREGVVRNYDETMRQRCRGVNVPIIYIGQRVHENDLTAHLLSGNDVDSWSTRILKGLDEAGNALYPEIMPVEKLLSLQEKSPYVFASQYQQNPIPSGGSLFRRSDFVILDEEPDIVATFITADTAESIKTWSDYSVFSFWGFYEIENLGRKTGIMGLHWLDCLEEKIEPRYLKEKFMDFYSSCLFHKKPPLIAAIEKKSSGVALLSALQDIRGIKVRDIERNANSGSKSDRFVSIESFVGEKRISLTRNARHSEMCIGHMTKITANNTHRHDDIADTLCDAIRIALIEKTLYNVSSDERQIERKEILSNLMSSQNRRINAGAKRYEGYG